MKKEIERLNEKYGISLNVEKERLDAFDNKSYYMTRVWDRINDSIVCITYTKASNKAEKLNDLEKQIINVLGGNR